MSKIGSSILKGAEQALAYAEGKKIKAKVHDISVPSTVDIKAIRKELDMSRKEFCEHVGFSIRTVEKWEHGLRCPEGPARAYLVVIAREPEAVERALSQS